MLLISNKLVNQTTHLNTIELASNIKRPTCHPRSCAVLIPQLPRSPRETRSELEKAVYVDSFGFHDRGWDLVCHFFFQIVVWIFMFKYLVQSAEVLPLRLFATTRAKGNDNCICLCF